MKNAKSARSGRNCQALVKIYSDGVLWQDAELPQSNVFFSRWRCWKETQTSKTLRESYLVTPASWMEWMWDTMGYCYWWKIACQLQYLLESGFEMSIHHIPYKKHSMYGILTFTPLNYPNVARYTHTLSVWTSVTGFLMWVHSDCFRDSGRGAFCWGATPCGEVCWSPVNWNRRSPKKTSWSGCCKWKSFLHIHYISLYSFWKV